MRYAMFNVMRASSMAVSVRDKGDSVRLEFVMGIKFNTKTPRRKRAERCFCSLRLGDLAAWIFAYGKGSLTA